MDYERKRTSGLLDVLLDTVLFLIKSIKISMWIFRYRCDAYIGPPVGTNNTLAVQCLQYVNYECQSLISE